MPSKEFVARAYLQALGSGDFLKIIELFDDDAVVQSPLYGSQPASLFFKRLLLDTSESKLELIEYFESDQATAAIYFEYTWIKKDSNIVVFNVVDIMKFRNNKILSLDIIYDTSVFK